MDRKAFGFSFVCPLTKMISEQDIPDFLIFSINVVYPLPRIGRVRCVFISTIFLKSSCKYPEGIQNNVFCNVFLDDITKGWLINRFCHRKASFDVFFLPPGPLLLNVNPKSILYPDWRRDEESSKSRHKRIQKNVRHFYDLFSRLWIFIRTNISLWI